MNSQPCWWEILVLEEGITAWGKIILQSPPRQPDLSLELHTTPGWATPALFPRPKVWDHGREPSSPSTEAHGNTSTRFVASPGDFSLLSCTSALRPSLFIVCPSNPGTVKALPINSALLGFMSCAWLTRCYDSWDEIRLQVNLLHSLEHFQVSLELRMRFRLRKSQRRKKGRNVVLLHPTLVINGSRNLLLRKQRWKNKRCLGKVEAQCSFSPNKKLPDRGKTHSHFPVHA